MTDLNDPDPQGPNDAALRVAETTRLFKSIRSLIDEMIQRIGDLDAQTPKAVLSKLNELQSTHLKVLTAEEAFHENHANTQCDKDIDFDAIRIDLGRQLDRLRAARSAD